MVETGLRMQVLEEDDRVIVTIDEGRPKGSQRWKIRKIVDNVAIEKDDIVVATSIAGVHPFDAAVDLMLEEVKKATRRLTDQIGAKIRQLTGEPTIQFDQSYPVRSKEG